MSTIVSLLLLLQEEPHPERERRVSAERLEKYRSAVSAGVRFPPRSEIDEASRKGRTARKVLDVFLDPEEWVRSLQRIDERTGLFSGTLEVQLRFQELEEAPAWGEGSGGKGVIGIDLKTLAKYQEEIERYERGRDSGREGVLPPARLDRILTHELAHCFQGTDQPHWFLEGMATWCAQDGHYISYYRHEKAVTGPIDERRAWKLAYARGWAFFEYIDAVYGREKLRKLLELALVRKIPAREAAAEAAGLGWKDLSEREQEWSRKWLRNYRLRP